MGSGHAHQLLAMRDLVGVFPAPMRFDEPPLANSGPVTNLDEPAAHIVFVMHRLPLPHPL